MVFFAQPITVGFEGDAYECDINRWKRPPEYVCFDDAEKLPDFTRCYTNSIILDASSFFDASFVEKAIGYIMDMGFLEVDEDDDRIVNELMSSAVSRMEVRKLR